MGRAGKERGTEGFTVDKEIYVNEWLAVGHGGRSGERWRRRCRGLRGLDLERRKLLLSIK